MTIPEIFATYGEPYFRSGEARVIARLLDSGPQVLATGGGAYMNADTRAAIRAQGRFGLAQGRFRGADAAREAAHATARCCRATIRPQTHRAADGRALSGLCGGRRDRDVARRRARNHRQRDHRGAAAPLGSGRLAAPASRSDTMTAPLRAGEPTIVNVALGERAYRHRDRPRAARRSSARRIAALRAGRRRPRSSPTRRSRAHHLARRRSGARGGRHRVHARSWCRPARRSKSWRMLESVCDAAARRPHRARRRRGGARRRRGRRSCRLRRGCCAAASMSCRCRPRCWRRSIPRSAARPAINSRHGKNLVGAFHQPIAGGRRHRAARHAARRATSAPAMPRSRNTACSAMPASSPGWRRTGRTCSPAVRRASTRSP